MITEILVVYKKNFEKVHDEALSSIRKVLDDLKNEYNLNVSFVAREKVTLTDFESKQLVIVLGGDGTLTSISHNIDDTMLVMGVNSDPLDQDKDGSFGFYMGSRISTFENDLTLALDGEAIINELPRLQAEITSASGNSIKSDPALNDLLIANTHQYAPSKYILKRSGINAKQSSSGLLFSTFFGQGAWFRHVCDIEGMRFDEKDIDSHYLVVARDLPRTNRNGSEYFEWTDKCTTIRSDMHRGYVVPDGWDEYHFNRGAVIDVHLNGPKLKLLTFKEPLIEKIRLYLD
tara:strand:- start:101 stop:967 length:867 start_codon:yes stop_codon:yes gene_type:complete